MDWLRGLFGLERLNPEDWERVRCDACRGTGGIRTRGANVHWCWKCHGKGWLMVRRAAEVPNGTPTAHASDAAEVRPVAAGPLAGMPDATPSDRSDDPLPLDPLDAPQAPTAPSPPRGLGGI